MSKMTDVCKEKKKIENSLSIVEKLKILYSSYTINLMSAYINTV